MKCVCVCVCVCLCVSVCVCVCLCSGDGVEDYLVCKGEIDYDKGRQHGRVEGRAIISYKNTENC